MWYATYPPGLSGPANAAASLRQDALPLMPLSDSASLASDSSDEFAPGDEIFGASPRKLEPTMRSMVPAIGLLEVISSDVCAGAMFVVKPIWSC